MHSIRIQIDGRSIDVSPGTTLLAAARQADIYIPALCSHPDLSSTASTLSSAAVYQGNRRIENIRSGEHAHACGLCVVNVAGESEPVMSCSSVVRDQMVVTTTGARIQAIRQEKLAAILTRHRHACLTCAQQEGCSRTQCSSNVPENERCCPQFGNCELQAVAAYIGIPESTPKWIPTDLPVLKNEPLFERDYNLCIGCTRCVRACRDLRGVDAIGFVYDTDGNIQIGTLAPTLSESGCKYCTACVAVCPTGALTDKLKTAKHEADLLPCRAACPAGIDIPEYIRLIAQGNVAAAAAVIREKVPLPAVLGRVCNHPCEAVCRRGEINEPVAICGLKRYAADHEPDAVRQTAGSVKESGKKIAIVGSGPAGLTAAFYLRKQGHQVALFEAEAKPGGMLRYGIPRYRLPLDVLEREVDVIFALGVRFFPHQRLGRDISVNQLLAEGYDAIFLAIGAQLSRRIAFDGCDHPDVIWGIDFLRRAGSGEGVRLKDNIVVIGGGNVAIDVAMTARRCGAQNVSIACLETETEMPADKSEIEEALAEGVVVLPSLGPSRIIGENGRITQLDMVECSSVFDENGNFCPCFNTENLECLPADQIILAVGQAADLSFIGQTPAISVRNNLIVTDETTMATSLPKVFAGGDVAASSGTVIQAIAAGRRAATAIDKSIGGTGAIDDGVGQETRMPKQYIGSDEKFASFSREQMPQCDPITRCQGFTEIRAGFSDSQAKREAGRCLQCDLRLFIDNNPRPLASCLAFTADNLMAVPDAEGVFRLLDDAQTVLSIKGTPSLRGELMRQLETNSAAVYFDYAEDKMYSKRESELIQQHLQEHGEMPGGGDDDLDDLF